LKFLASTFPEILGGPKIRKSGLHDPHMTPFDVILHFLSELNAIGLRAKFEVSSFNLREILGGLKISKVGHVTPT